MNSHKGRFLLPGMLMYSAALLIVCSVFFIFLPQHPVSGAVFYVRCALSFSGLCLMGTALCFGRSPGRIPVCIAAGLLIAAECVSLTANISDARLADNASVLISMAQYPLNAAALAILAAYLFRPGKALIISAIGVFGLSIALNALAVVSLYEALPELHNVLLRGSSRLTRMLFYLREIMLRIAVIIQCAGLLVFVLIARKPERSGGSALTAPEAPSFESIKHELIALNELHAGGMISEAEYTAARSDILKKL